MPSSIGDYTIKRVIATGGMGTVYEAVQENPRRTVAVKVVKSGMATENARLRFARETQTLARLRHPGIAQIYEAGTYEHAGVTLPFFAMEYIPNASTIVAYAQARRLSTRQKLELFIQVCDAVHFGHQRGIIHRDLKPGNLLVDSQARVRVIDFGVARAMDSDPDSSQTQAGQFVGTAPYMSPEQFDADPNDLDTRSDVYSLGVVLYELLAGQLPYEFANLGLFEVARMVREGRPKSIAEDVPNLDSELVLITKTALTRIREDRYQSAHGLGSDIRRYLAGEAIAARPPSLSYQIRVLVRRHRAVTALATVTLAILIAGIVTTTALYVDVRDERSKSEEAARQAIAANEFLIGALGAVVPVGYGDVKTIGDLCDRVSEDVGEAFPDDPITEADVRLKIGLIYQRLQNLEKAELHLKKAFELRRDNLGSTHQLTLEALDNLKNYYGVYEADEKCVAAAEEYYTAISSHYEPQTETYQNALFDLYGAYLVSGRYTDAVKIAQQALTNNTDHYGADSHEAISSQKDLALALVFNGNTSEALVQAEQSYGKALALTEGEFSIRDHCREAYAAILLTAGEISAAKKLYNHQTAPEFIDIEKNYQGELGNLNQGIKVVVFFETWCPFSQRLLPKIEQASRQYTAHGIDFVSLTRVQRSSSDALVRKFIRDNQLSISVVRESGRTWNYFEATGTPYLVILHEGEVVMKGTGVGDLTTALLEGLLSEK